jgi:hypothetical protein
VKGIECGQSGKIIGCIRYIIGQIELLTAGQLPLAAWVIEQEGITITDPANAVAITIALQIEIDIALLVGKGVDPVLV